MRLSEDAALHVVAGDRTMKPVSKDFLLLQPVFSRRRMSSAEQATHSTLGNRVMKELRTWGGRRGFKYSGSVASGTDIRYGRGWRQLVSREQYTALLGHFRGRTVSIGTSRDNRPKGSVGEWFKEHVTQTAIASYVGAILIHEGYAEKGLKSSDIRFTWRHPAGIKDQSLQGGDSHTLLLTKTLPS